MLNFSEKNQAFYDLNLNYSDLPGDLVALSDDQYKSAFASLQKGCHVFKDLTCSEPRPTQYHIWNRGKWVDKRTQSEKRIDFLNTLKPLTRRQFKLALLENDLLEKVESTIDNIPDLTLRKRMQIEYSESVEFQRQSESVITMCEMLELSEDQVDQLWLHAMSL
ncbi:hypothetical protein [Acinetobacter junii]|uniref:hypothetical protein n=1 Tax=Acinetobacter junii TaxID=40215 RepID=UPI00124F74B4|nr:hypothetical protein [Acinetobacter junii]